MAPVGPVQGASLLSLVVGIGGCIGGAGAGWAGVGGGLGGGEGQFSEV